MKLKLLNQLRNQCKQDNQAGRVGSVVAVIGATFVIALAALVLLNKQWVVDQYVAKMFVASSEIQLLESRAGMNETGQFYMAASQAEVVDKAAFNTACGNLQNEKTVVIGCYTNPEKRLYVYNVTDPQLDGVKETSAAHEMLHAAYDRLSLAEKDRVNKLLLAEKAKVKDQRLLELIAYYETAEPTAVVDELHSIFGTELRSLSAELETYYTRYFNDRSKVVALKEKYEKVFTDLAAHQKQLVEELSTIASTVSVRETAYETALEQLNSDIRTFNQWAESGAATKAEYDQRRARLQARIGTLENERSQINALIDSYAAKKAELEQLNTQAVHLNQSIDSKLAPTPSL